MNNYASIIQWLEISKDGLERIVSEVKNGNGEELEKLSIYLYERIYRYIFYRVRHHEDAEDITSETIMKVIKNLKTQKGNFLGWVYKIAYNTLMDHYRRMKKNSALIYDDVLAVTQNKDNLSAKSILLKDKLQEALTHLTKEQAEVIILKFIEDHSNEEIAQLTNKSIGAVKVLQFRALKALRKYFKQKGYEIKD